MLVAVPLDAAAADRLIGGERTAGLLVSDLRAALTDRLGAGPGADIADPAPASPVSPVRPDARTVLIRTKTPTEPSSWRFVPRSEDGGKRLQVSTPMSPMYIDASHDGVPYDTSAAGSARNQSVRPLVRVSQAKVHRRRRGLVALVLLLLVGLAGGGGAYYYFAEARWTSTPNLDGLAAQGMRFTQAYAAANVCSPTRASIMTGKYPARLHTTNFFGGNRRGMLLPLLSG